MAGKPVTKAPENNAVVPKQDPSTIQSDSGVETFSMSDPAALVKKSRRGCLLLILLPLLLLMALFFFRVDEKLVPSLSESVTGYRISFMRSGVNPLCLNELKVQHKEASEEGAPLLAIDSLQIHWEWPRPSSGMRPLKEMVARHISVKLEEQAAAPVEDAAGSVETKSLVFNIPAFVLPRTIRFEDFSLQVDREDSRARLDGLQGTVAIESLDEIFLLLGGEHLQASWLPEEGGEAITFPEGTMEAQAQWSESGLTAEVRLDLPEFMKVQSQLQLALEPVPTLKAQVEHFTAEGPLPGEFMAPFLPMPLHFSSLTAAPLSLEARLVEGMPTLDELAFDLLCSDLLVGEEGESWYQGNVTLSAFLEPGEEQRARWTVQLNRNQQIEGTLEAEAGGMRFQAEARSWKRDALLALMPAAYEDYQSFLALSELKSFSCDLHVNASGLKMNGKLDAAMTAPFALAAELQGVYQWGGAGDFKATLRSGEAALMAQAAMDPSTGLALHSDWKSWPLAYLTALLPAEDEGLTPGGLLAGRVEVKKEPGKDVAVNGAVTVTELSHDSWLPGGPLTELSAQATVRMSEDFSTLHSFQGTAEGADLFSLVLTGGKGDLKKGRIRVDLQGDVDLMELGSLLDQRNLWGTARCEASLTTGGWQELTVNPCVLTLESVGYGDYSLPYGEELVVQAPARLSLADFKAAVGPVEATLGDTSRLHSDPLHFQGTTMTAEGKLSFSSDFSPLIAKQWLHDGEGQFSAEVEDLRFNEEGLHGTLRFSMPPASLTLSQSLARLSGLSAEGRVTLEPSLSGEASFSLEEGTAAGITVKAAPARMLFEEGVATIDDLSLGLLGGDLKLSLKWETLEAGMPLTIRSTIDHIDLGVFTDEFKPQSLILTGIVRGEVSCVLTPTRLRDFNLMLESTENFSMNRDMVEQLLLNQYMDDMAGGRQMGRMLQSVLGKKAQTAFDRAQLTLGLEDERIAGTALLESKSLNLTVDIKADPPALLEALRARQER